MSSNDDKIVQAERHFGVRFPADYRHFLATEGSMSQFIPPADDFLITGGETSRLAIGGLHGRHGRRVGVAGLV